MKAVVIEKYGLPERFPLQEIPKPVPTDDQVLVKIKASGVNFADSAFVKGTPLIARFFVGLLRPHNRVPGADFAGIIESVGMNVTGYKPGDAVFGFLSHDNFGAYAEYAVIEPASISPIPSNLTFEETAVVPQAAIVALQGLRDIGKIREGMNVLIYGASGGIGSFGVQIAKSYGTNVTGVCGPTNLGWVKDLGADMVIDYTRDDFTRSATKYDLILATAGFRTLSDYKRALSPQGMYVATGGKMKQIFQAMLLGPIVSEKGGRKLTNLAAKDSGEDLRFIKDLIEAGKVKPVIDKQFGFDEVADAIRYYSLGHTKGKVSISIDPP